MNTKIIIFLLILGIIFTSSLIYLFFTDKLQAESLFDIKGNEVGSITSQVEREIKQITQGTTTYTPNSKTICKDGKCIIKISPNQNEYVYENETWKNFRDAVSLIKYFPIIYKERDKDTDLDVIDFNYTSTTLKPTITSMNFNKDIPLSLVSAEDSKTQLSLPINLNYKDDKGSIITFPLSLFKGDIKFGNNSTIISITNVAEDGKVTCTLDDCTGENVARTTNAGINAMDREVGGNFWERGYVEFNTTSIPDGSIIIDTRINITARYINNPGQVYIKDITGEVIASSDANLWEDMNNGTLYINTAWQDGQQDEIRTFDLGTQADSDLQNKLTLNWFGFGWSNGSSNLQVELYDSELGVSGTQPTLIVTYSSYNITTCQAIITAGSYALINDIINSTATPSCIKISSDNVELNCNWHLIDGQDISITYGIYQSSLKTNITIKNCLLQDWARGMYLAYVRNITINNIIASSNTDRSFYFSQGKGAFLNNATSIGATKGIVIAGGLTYFSLTNSTIQGASETCIRLDSGSSSNSFYNNIFNCSTILTTYGSNYLAVLNTTKTAGTNIIGGGNIGGNYYTKATANGFSDTCSDADKDGICDSSYTPYSLSPNIKDYLPLSSAYLDTTPPTLDFYSPLNNTYMSGMVILKATASDVRGIKNVTFYYKNSTENNYNFIRSDDEAPYYHFWNIAGINDDSYLLQAITYDNSGFNSTAYKIIIIDKTYPSVVDMNIEYPEGKSVVRNNQTITLYVNVTDGTSGAGINISRVNLINLNGTGISKMLLQSGSTETGSYSYWNLTINISTSTGLKFAELFVNDSAIPNNLRRGDMFEVQVDNNIPTYLNLYHQPYLPYNNTEASFYATLYDNYNLSKYIFSSNLTGSWVNDSEINFTEAYTIKEVITSKIVKTGNYSYRYYFWDEAGNYNFTSINSIQVLGNYIPTEFYVSNAYPLDSSTLNHNSIQFNFSYSGGVAQNCSLYLNELKNQTIKTPSNNTILNFTIINLAEGSHYWLVECIENVTLISYNSTASYFNIDTIYPLINISFPVNLGKYNYSITTINWTYTESSPYNCFYSLGTSNISTSCSENITGLSSNLGNNNWSVYINDSAGNLNVSRVSFNYSIPPGDTTAPWWAPYPSNVSYAYGTYIAVQLNATDNSGIGCYRINDTRFSMNCSGYLGNATTLGVARYYLNASVNDTSNNLNYSYFWIDVGAISQLITPKLNGVTANLSITYPQQVNASFTSIYGNQTTLTIKINGTQINIGQNYTWGVGEWIVNWSVPANQNWTASENYYNLSIKQGAGSITLLLNGSAGNILINSTSQVNASANNLTGNLLLLRNNVDKSAENNIFISLPVGYYNYTAYSLSNQNYTLASITRWVNVTNPVGDTTPPIFTNCRNFTHTINTSFSQSITATDDSGIDAYILNQTIEFNVSITAGLITNISNLDIVYLYDLNLSVNDTNGNYASCEFWINIINVVTTTTTTISNLPCKYTKLGYYNLKLPWFKEVNCL